MAAASKDKDTELFKKYIAQKQILIADAQASSRTGLAKTLINLGATMNNITLVSGFEEAEALMKQNQPHVVVADFDLGKRCGLDLLQKQREENPDAKNSLFVLVTGNTSQSAVAQAAEEDVDAFILKPYTIGVLRQSLMRAALSKIYPSDYVKKIEEGKNLLYDGKVQESMKVFEEAMQLDSKPSLALFYFGQAQYMQKALDDAAGSYEKGLAHNKIHYKCMVGLYEVLMERKLYKEAYDVIKRISRYFPANPKRLTQVLRLAVMTQSYEDIERYYQNFADLDSRNEELIKYICAALVVCGKFYLQRNLSSRAISLFQKAGTAATGRTRLLREIIQALVEFDLAKDAKEFLGKFPPEAQNGADFLAMTLLVSDKLDSSSKVIEMGRKLIQGKIQDPVIYEVVIRQSVQANFTDSAMELSQQACKLWPEQKERFEALLQKAG